MKNPFSSVAARKLFPVVLCRRVNEIFITHSGTQSDKLKGMLSQVMSQLNQYLRITIFDFLFLSLAQPFIYIHTLSVAST